ALLDRILGILGLQPVIRKFQDQVPGVVLYRGNVSKHLAQAFLQKPFVGVLLHLDEIGHVQDFLYPGKTHSGSSAQFYGMYHQLSPHSIMTCKKNNVTDRLAFMQINRSTGLVGTTSGVCSAFCILSESNRGKIAQQSDREIRSANIATHI